MRRRGYLRSKARGKDPIGALYGREVKRRRRLYNLPASIADPHHPAGRLGKNKLFFVLIEKSLHREIHEHPNTARQMGWLANINGTFSVDEPRVVRARQRFEELVRELEEQEL